MDMDITILEIFYQINTSKAISFVDIIEMEKLINEKIIKLDKEKENYEKNIYIRYSVLLKRLEEQVSIKKEILARDILEKNYEKELNLYLDSIKSNKSDSIVFMFTGTSRMQNIKSYRSSYIAKEFIARNIPVIYSTWRWLNYSDFEKSYKDSLLFESPIDKTLEYMLKVIRYDFNIKNKIFIIEFPHPSISKYIEVLKFHGWTVIYDIMDDWEEFHNVKQASWYKKNHEIYIVDKVDICTAVACTLVNKFDKEIYLLPNALDSSVFKKYEKSRNEIVESKNADIQPRFKQIIKFILGDKTNYRTPKDYKYKVGYVGHLTSSWFDWDNLVEVAKNLPEYTFEIIGHSMNYDISKLPSNIMYIGPKPFEEVIKISNDWTVGIIPFKIGNLSDGVDPLKVYEYIAMGLNVVSFRMPQITNYPNVITTNSVEEFVDAIKISMNKPFDYDLASKFLMVNTWQNRVDTLFELINNLNKDGENK